MTVSEAEVRAAEQAATAEGLINTIKTAAKVLNDQNGNTAIITAARMELLADENLRKIIEMEDGTFSEECVGGDSVDLRSEYKQAGMFIYLLVTNLLSEFRKRMDALDHSDIGDAVVSAALIGTAYDSGLSIYDSTNHDETMIVIDDKLANTGLQFGGQVQPTLDGAIETARDLIDGQLQEVDGE